ncbi:MAG: ParA family protein [Blautia faecis]
MDRVRPQQNRLKKALQQVADQYDFCVVDNAPDINISVINALTAANDVLIPVEVDDNTLEGMNELLDSDPGSEGRTESEFAERPLLCEQVPEWEPGTHSGERDHQRAVSGYGYNNPLFWCSGKERIHAYAGGFTAPDQRQQKTMKHWLRST